MPATHAMSHERRREVPVLLPAGAVLPTVSAIGPRDRFTWFLEVAPLPLGVPVLVATYRRCSPADGCIATAPAI
jgi:putative membrane protein